MVIVIVIASIVYVVYGTGVIFVVLLNSCKCSLVILQKVRLRSSDELSEGIFGAILKLRFLY